MSTDPDLGCVQAPARIFDVALLDLDGVVYIGEHAVPGAIPALMAAASCGMGLAYVTNNASRTPAAVATHLRELGLPADDTAVVTSAQAGARLLLERLGPGAQVLAIGGPGVAEALRESGLTPVHRRTEQTAAILQGFGRDVGWADLAEAALAVQAGLPWIASNPDLTVPIPGGRGPGNGALVQAVATAAGRAPDDIAGKPHPALMRESILRTGATRPLVVGDRLDTDIEGARRAGVPSLLVLTGITRPLDLLVAPPAHRPDLVSADLDGLLAPHEPPQRGGPGDPPGWTAAGIGVWVESGALVTDLAEDAGPAAAIAALRCACRVAWADPSADPASVAAHVQRSLPVGSVGDSVGRAEGTGEEGGD